ncbi:NUDIX domain-containing protein [Tsukamurella asaccharolytica]|uniref:8-oxo-dGTP diphosphatase n=1 Tax=Tsukamurella asaccharolytica TaxID=2592067 RepID=A0A5C5R918_9ACTN|nr:NUDIX domain-containing protein [Tsukamurella asaccharolytica]TWS18681.1 NUDIX domain-containing protein [Tsukamurella asaccharolytica]
MHSDAPRLVVGAIIVDDLEQPTRVFAARRTGPAALAGLWEFPGGKTEEGETPEAALVREIHEELGATISVGPELPHISGAWPISENYEMRLYFAAVAYGELVSGDSHDKLCWIAPSDLGSITWLPSDAGAIETIQELISAWTA